MKQYILGLKLVLLLLLLAGFSASAWAETDKAKSGSLFGKLPEKTGSGGGLFMLYGFSHLNASETGGPRLVGGRGYSQLGRYLRVGGFAALGSGVVSATAPTSLLVYGGPYLQLVLPFDPLFLAVGSKFGLGMDFSRPTAIDYLLLPHVELELRLFDHLSVSVGVDYFRNRSSSLWPAMAQYNLSVAINILHFSTDSDQGPGLKELPKL